MLLLQFLEFSTVAVALFFSGMAIEWVIEKMGG